MDIANAQLSQPVSEMSLIEFPCPFRPASVETIT